MTRERDARIAALMRVAARFADAHHADGRRAREAVVHDGALSVPMAEWALRTACARYTADALAACSAVAMYTERVGVVLGVSVPVAPLRAIALPLLRGAGEVQVRPSRRQPRFANVLLDALIAEGLPVVRAKDDDPAAFVARATAEQLRTLIAYGGDAAIASMQTALDASVTFEGHGHGTGIALAFGDAPVEGLARDIAHYDQSGCLSPQMLVAIGGDARELGRRLDRALHATEGDLPRGPLDAGLGARVAQWQGTQAVTAAAFFRGRAHAVAVLERAAVVGSPGARNIAIASVASAADAAALLATLGPYLTSVGSAGTALDAARAAIPPDAHARVVLAGTMQDPAMDGPEDPRPAVTNH